MPGRSPVMAFLRVIPLCAILAASCMGGSRPDSRDVVINLFTAIRTSDTLFLRTQVDLKSASQSVADELGAATIPAEEQLLGALTGEGALRKRWLENQIVVGRSQVKEDTSWVEVSFIDRMTRIQYYNKMKLQFHGGQWVVTSFKTL